MIGSAISPVVVKVRCEVTVAIASLFENLFYLCDMFKKCLWWCRKSEVKAILKLVIFLRGKDRS